MSGLSGYNLTSSNIFAFETLLIMMMTAEFLKITMVDGKIILTTIHFKRSSSIRVRVKSSPLSYLIPFMESLMI